MHFYTCVTVTIYARLCNIIVKLRSQLTLKWPAMRAAVPSEKMSLL